MQEVEEWHEEPSDEKLNRDEAECLDDIARALAGTLTDADSSSLDEDDSEQQESGSEEDDSGQEDQTENPVKDKVKVRWELGGESASA